MKAVSRNSAAPAFPIYADEDSGSYLATAYRLFSLEQQLAAMDVAEATL